MNSCGWKEAALYIWSIVALPLVEESTRTVHRRIASLLFFFYCKSDSYSYGGLSGICMTRKCRDCPATMARREIVLTTMKEDFPKRSGREKRSYHRDEKRRESPRRDGCSLYRKRSPTPQAYVEKISINLQYLSILQIYILGEKGSCPCHQRRKMRWTAYRLQSPSKLRKKWVRSPFQWWLMHPFRGRKN